MPASFQISYFDAQVQAAFCALTAQPLKTGDARAFPYDLTRELIVRSLSDGGHEWYLLPIGKAH